MYKIHDLGRVRLIHMYADDLEISHSKNPAFEFKPYIAS